MDMGGFLKGVPSQDITIRINGETLWFGVPLFQEPPH